MLPPTPDLASCTASASCALGIVFGTGVPILVLIFVVLRVSRFETPSVFKEFISREDVLEASTGTVTESQPQSSAHADDSTEQTPLLSRSASHPARPSTWRQIVLVALALLHIPVALVHLTDPDVNYSFRLTTSSIFTVSWTYAALRIVLRPSCTPYYDVLALFVAELLSVLVYIYERYRMSEVGGYFLMLVAQVVWSIAGIAVIVTMPLSVSQADQDGLFAPEDTCTLWQWMTFTWVSPLISLGKSQTLEEKDVWKLGGTMRAKVLMHKFLGLQHSSLLRRILVANSKDFMLDCLFTFIETLMNFSGPFFLNLILKAMLADPRTENAPTVFTEPVSDSLHFYASVMFDSTMLPTSVRKLAPSLEDMHTARELNRGDAYFFAFAHFVCRFIMAQCHLHCLYFSRRASIRIDTELKASIYEKILRHKDVSGTTSTHGESDDPQKSSGGEASRIITLISADVTRLSVTLSQGPFVYESTFSIFFASAMLYNLMGWTAFTGYIVFLLTLPLNLIIGKRLTMLHRMEFTMRDRRMQAVNEAIQAIKLIKFSGWESRWINRILDVRQTELGWIWKLKLWYIFNRMLWQVVPVLVLATSFVCFTLFTDREMSVDIAFPCIAIFGILSPSLTAVPLVISWATQCLLAFKRIDNYLSEPDVPDRVSSLKRPAAPPRSDIDARIGCTNATFRWPVASVDSKDTYASPVELKKPTVRPKGWGFFRLNLWSRNKPAEQTETEDETPEAQNEDLPFELRDISVIFPEAAISLVCGPTGSGKSALLAALLGEMDHLQGEVLLPKEPTRLHNKTGLPLMISYCAQQPWLEHKSIKGNILFGSPFERARYEATLACCALLPDLSMFPHGDETEIGEKGVSLSGGQKARVALARAVYARTQVVLLDDVLSAVDTHTAEHIINQCLLGPLMRQRTIILVTHHIDLVLPIVAWTVKLRQGRIEDQGTVSQLRQAGKLVITRTVPEAEMADQDTNRDKEVSKLPEESNSKLVKDEDKYSGMVRPEIYKTYLSATSYWLFGLLVACLSADQLMQLVEKLWLKYWSESYEVKSNSSIMYDWYKFNFPSASQNVLPYLLVFVSIESAIAAIASVGIFFTMNTLDNPLTINDGALVASKDIDVIDGDIQDFLHMFVKQLATLLVSVATVVYVFPSFGIFAIAIAYIHVWIASGYTNKARDLRRIESITRSPVLSSFSEVINGVTTVRAFGSERLFLERLFKRLDSTETATYHFWMCSRWLALRFDVLGAVSIFVATVGSLTSGANAGLAGIAIVQAQKLVQAIRWTIRDWTELEQSLNSVERIHEYLSLPSEPPAPINSERPLSSWPSASTGTLVVNNLVIKYAPELEPVLKGLTFETKPSEKIGIVGRTGSGKSTLALSLFRFVDPTSGSITIDGIDITTIGLDDLRSRLTLIPQDAILFKGTLRDNLDPFNEYTDAECIESLYRVHLNTAPPHDLLTGPVQAGGPTGNGQTESSSKGDTVSQQASSLEGPASSNGFTLGTKVSDGGGNFSHGQRQLISLARALLRRSNIIVMDESTASVDFETDTKIQNTIRKEFKQSILLTIAHRLRTVMDNDRILVLDAGRVVEFDSPKNLLDRPNGIFYEMCKRSGHYDELVKSAHSKD